MTATPGPNHQINCFMRLIYQSTFISPNSNAKTRVYNVYAHGAHKFKIYIESSSGKCLDTNSHCTLSIMTNEGTWALLTDNRQINCDYDETELNYGRDIQKKRDIIDDIIEEFEYYVSSIYGLDDE